MAKKAAQEVPVKLVINCETNEVTEVPYSQEEIDQMITDQIAYEEAKKAEEAAKAEAEAQAQSGKAKLKALGLTDDEIAALTK